MRIALGAALLVLTCGTFASTAPHQKEFGSITYFDELPFDVVNNQPQQETISFIVVGTNISFDFAHERLTVCARRFEKIVHGQGFGQSLTITPSPIEIPLKDWSTITVGEYTSEHTMMWTTYGRKSANEPFVLLVSRHPDSVAR